MEHIKYNKDKVEGHKQEIQEILDTLDATGSSPDDNPDMGRLVSRLALTVPNNGDTTSVYESGASSPRIRRPFAEYQLSSDPFFFLCSACGRLVGRAFDVHEFPSLIEAIFSTKDEIDAICCLHGDDAQAFIDVIDEVCFRSPSLF